MVTQPFAAANMPLTTTYTAIAQDAYGWKNTNTATVSLATTVTFHYNLNRNLTNDGLRSFAYDGENQLPQVWVIEEAKKLNGLLKVIKRGGTMLIEWTSFFSVSLTNNYSKVKAVVKREKCT